MTSLVQLPTRRPGETGYRRLRMIGSGGSAQVFLARSTNAAAAAAAVVVVIKRILIDQDETLQFAQREIAVMQALPPHPNLVRFIDAFIDSDAGGEHENDAGGDDTLSLPSTMFVNIVQEYSAVGDLERLLAARREHGVPGATPAEAVFLAAQLLIALRHLHSHSVISRDIKPLNTTFSFWWWPCSDGAGDDSAALDVTAKNKKGGDDDASNECVVAKMWRARDASWTPTRPCTQDAPGGLTACSACLAFHTPLSQLRLCLIDMGVARTLSRTHHSLAQTTVGTPNYLSPEMIDGEGCSFAADIWAAGAVVWELAFHNGRERLFGGDNMLAVVKSIAAAKIKPFATQEHERALRPLIERCLRADPAQRPSADEALRAFFPARAPHTTAAASRKELQLEVL